MEWSEVLANPLFENLPFKIELNRFGQILMSPASNSHGNMEYRVGRALEQSCPPGEIIIECAIQTSDGVKVADVAWASTGFINEFGYSTPYPQAPEICVEILSPSNSDEEMRIKTELYLARGAQEVWLVNAQGKLRFFSHSGELTGSPRAGAIRLD
jgi:Uma2 family endonuclease